METQNNPYVVQNPYTPAVPQAKPEEKKKLRYEMGRRDVIFTILISVSCVFLVMFGLFGGFHIGYSIGFCMLFASLIAYFIGKESKTSVFSITCIILSFLGSATFTLSSNGSVRFWLFVVTFIMGALSLLELSGRTRRMGDLGIIVDTVTTTFGKAFPRMPRTLFSLFSSSGKKGSVWIKIIVGVACSIPVLFVVIPILISSDVAFEGFIKKILSDFFENLLKAALGLVVAVFLVSYAVALKKDEKPQIPPKNFAGIDNVFIISFLSMISLSYIAYLFSQLAYFFSAFSGFLPENYEFTFAGYARRGFFEMCVIAVINLVIIFTSILLSKKQSKKCITLKILCVFIGIFTLIIVSTAISKMVMYISNYGMTVLRITTSAFMLFIAVVFIAVIIRCFTEKAKVLNTALITAAVVLVVLGLGNVNHFVADYNYNAYKNGYIKEMDVETIYELGDEGVPYLVSLAEDEDKEVARQAKNKLYYCLHFDYYDVIYPDDYSQAPPKEFEKRYTHFEEWSLSRGRAYAAIEQYLEENPNFIYYEMQY